MLAQLALDNVKVEKLVREFLSAQSLTILPQNSFGDAVSQFVDKDDRHAMEMFVNESLSNQVKHLLDMDQTDEDELHTAMEQYRSKLEELFAAGQLKKKRPKLKPRPDGWDSELDGAWGDQPGALMLSDRENGNEDEEDETSVRSPAPATRARGGRGSRGGRGASRAKATTSTTRETAATKRRGTTTTQARGRKKQVQAEEEENEDMNGDQDVVMLDDDDEEDDDALFVKPARGGRRTTTTTTVTKTRAAPAPRRTSTRASAASSARGKQTQLTFSQATSTRSQAGNGGARKAQELVSTLSIRHL